MISISKSLRIPTKALSKKKPLNKRTTFTICEKVHCEASNLKSIRSFSFENDGPAGISQAEDPSFIPPEEGEEPPLLPLSFKQRLAIILLTTHSRYKECYPDRPLASLDDSETEGPFRDVIQRNAEFKELFPHEQGVMGGQGSDMFVDLYARIYELWTEYQLHFPVVLVKKSSYAHSVAERAVRVLKSFGAHSVVPTLGVTLVEWGICSFFRSRPFGRRQLVEQKTMSSPPFLTKHYDPLFVGVVCSLLIVGKQRTNYMNKKGG